MERKVYFECSLIVVVRNISIFRVHEATRVSTISSITELLGLEGSVRLVGLEGMASLERLAEVVGFTLP